MFLNFLFLFTRGLVQFFSGILVDLFYYYYYYLFQFHALKTSFKRLKITEIKLVHEDSQGDII